MDFELILNRVGIVIKVQLNVVWASDGVEIEKSEIFVNLAAGIISSKSLSIP